MVFCEKKVVYLQLMTSLYTRYITIRYVLFLLLLWPLVTYAVGPTAGFDSLRHLSTEELMEQGRGYYIQRQPAQALACFTIISERSTKTDADSKLRVRVDLFSSKLILRRRRLVSKHLLHIDHPHSALVAL